MSPSLNVTTTDSSGIISIVLGSPLTQISPYPRPDTGEGIHPKEINRIFERFYMSDLSRNSFLGGQGIGLSIVKSIIKAHNGTITVKSDYGKGSTFTVILPVKR